MALFAPVFEALDRARVRFVVVGGVAVVLHGHARLTADLDLAIDLHPDAARRAIDALVGLGLRPSAPVDPAGFADPGTRSGWVAEKAMRVFAMHHPSDALLRVDLFVEDPIPFEELWARSIVMRVGQSDIHVASIADLIAMKEPVGRPIDLEDIARLRALEEGRDDRA